ncbi:AI-2E family transporter [Desulfovibrio sp. X2]|uniref:AI-2E family transporter n=1 Tax=Desulfovibrio sp. X2 TaxID=941449 RepID=UPI001269033B|nr:AI-2E family transporter [Desulfovibrio sp. X2]
MKRLRELLVKSKKAEAFYAWFPLILLLVGLWLIYGIFSPFLDTIIFAIVLAAIFKPLYNRVLPRLGGRETIAALLVALLIAVCILVPAVVFFGGMIGQGREAVTEITTWLKTHDLKTLIQNEAASAWLARLQAAVPFVDLSQYDIPARLLGITQAFGQRLLSLSTMFLGNAVVFLIHFALMIFFLFYLLKDGRAWLDKLVSLVPMRNEQVEAVFLRLRKVGKAVLVGGLLVALLQGLVGGVGLALVGVPGLFWGTMVAFSSLIPVVGTGLIWVPMAIWLLLIGRWEACVFLSAWYLILVTHIDTFLRPYFMRGSSQMPVLFIFLAVIGGVNAYGPRGILYGPLILSFATAMIRIYGQEYAHVLSSDERLRSMACESEHNVHSPLQDPGSRPTEEKISWEEAAKKSGGENDSDTSAKGPSSDS